MFKINLRGHIQFIFQSVSMGHPDQSMLYAWFQVGLIIIIIIIIINCFTVQQITTCIQVTIKLIGTMILWY